MCLRFSSSLIGDGSQETVNSLAQSFIKTLRYKPLGITPTTRAWTTNLSASMPPLRKSTPPKRQVYQMNIPDLQILIARFGNNMKQLLLISAISDIPKVLRSSYWWIPTPKKSHCSVCMLIFKMDV